MSCKIPVHEPPTKSPILKNKVIGTEIEKTRAKMVPQTLNMVDGILRPVRILKVQKNGDLCDKYDENISLLCEYDPQGITLKCFTGKQYHLDNGQSHFSYTICVSLILHLLLCLCSCSREACVCL